MGDNEIIKQVLEKFARGGYSNNSGQFKADLIRGGYPSSRAAELANQGSQLGATVASTTQQSNSAISTLSNSASGVGNMVKTVAKGAVGAAFAPAYDQLNYNRSIVQIGDIKNAFNSVIDNGVNVFAQIKSLLTGAAGIGVQVVADAYKREGELLLSITQKGGMVGEYAEGFQKSINSIVPDAQRLGINFDDIKDATQVMVSNSQKFSTYQGESVLNALKISAAYGETAKFLLESTERFRDVGVSLSDASGLMEKAGKQSIAQGLSARATTKNITENLKELNNFGFKNGVEGLSNMVRQAQALNFDMKETFNVAKKLYDPEGAIDLAANLQVIGGAFGDLNDPIKLMYDATNNVESLQTSILGAARSLATYNAEQGRFEVTGANLRRAKAMAETLGVSMEQLTSSAIKGQVKMQALSEIDIFSLDDDQKEFVSNLASMKEGVIGFELPKKLQEDLKINQSFIAASSLNSTQLAIIAKSQQELAKKTTDEVIREQYTVATQTLNSINAILLMVGNMAKGGIDSTSVFKEVKKQLLEQNADLDKLTPEDINNKINDVMSNMVNPVFGKVKNFIEKGSEKVNDLYQSSGVKEPVEKIIDAGKKAGSEAVNFVKDKLTSQVDIKVDLNSNSTELAQMFVNEINKNPQLRSDLASSLSKGMKNYVA